MTAMHEMKANDPRPHIVRIRGEYVCTLPLWRAQWLGNWAVGVGATPTQAFKEWKQAA